MGFLTPTDLTPQRRQLRPQVQNLPQTVGQQIRVGGIVDVGLHHKGIATHFLGGGRLQSMAHPYHPLIDLGQRLWVNQA